MIKKRSASSILSSSLMNFRNNVTSYDFVGVLGTMSQPISFADDVRMLDITTGFEW